MTNTFEKLEKFNQYQSKRNEIKEANKKNKILKYLREQTIVKENEQRNGNNKDFDEDSVSNVHETPLGKIGLGDSTDK